MKGKLIVVLKRYSKKLRTTNYELKTMNDKGFTLIEMVFVIVILAVVAAISIHFLTSSLRVYTMSVNQKILMDEAKLALERMCRDIRDAQNISTPAAGGSGSLVTFTRTSATAQDSASEILTFRLTGTTLEKVKTIPLSTNPLASNVSLFSVTRSATEEEIKIVLTLSLGTGENLTLQTKVYPKNLAKNATYKNFFLNWKEEVSS